MNVITNKRKKSPVLPRNPVAGASRRVNKPKVERDRTKYRRKDKHRVRED